MAVRRRGKRWVADYYDGTRSRRWKTFDTKDAAKDFEAEQSVPFLDWLAAYTTGAAYAGAQEDERGSLTPGKLADLVVLDRADTGARVLQTWKRGDLVFSATP